MIYMCIHIYIYIYQTRELAQITADCCLNVGIKQLARDIAKAKQSN